jgi:hypothetical protein
MKATSAAISDIAAQLTTVGFHVSEITQPYDEDDTQIFIIMVRTCLPQSFEDVPKRMNSQRVGRLSFREGENDVHFSKFRKKQHKYEDSLTANELANTIWVRDNLAANFLQLNGYLPLRKVKDNVDLFIREFKFFMDSVTSRTGEIHEASARLLPFFLVKTSSDIAVEAVKHDLEVTSPLVTSMRYGMVDVKNFQQLSFAPTEWLEASLLPEELELKRNLKQLLSPSDFD